MCDFAPRQSLDWSLAILRLTAATAGLFMPPRVIVSDTVMLIDDTPPAPDRDREFATELGGIAAAINAGATTTPGDTSLAKVEHMRLRASGVCGGEGEAS